MLAWFSATSFYYSCLIKLMNGWMYFNNMMWAECMIKKCEVQFFLKACAIKSVCISNLSAINFYISFIWMLLPKINCLPNVRYDEIWWFCKCSFMWLQPHTWVFWLAQLPILRTCFIYPKGPFMLWFVWYVHYQFLVRTIKCY